MNDIVTEAGPCEGGTGIRPSDCAGAVLSPESLIVSSSHTLSGTGSADLATTWIARQQETSMYVPRFCRASMLRRTKSVDVRLRSSGLARMTSDFGGGR